jgi:hypothetical protein
MSPIDWSDLFFWDIAGQRNFAYYELTGPLASGTNVRGQNPFAIDPTKLEITLQHALSRLRGFACLQRYFRADGER